MSEITGTSGDPLGPEVDMPEGVRLLNRGGCELQVHVLVVSVGREGGHDYRTECL